MNDDLIHHESHSSSIRSTADCATGTMYGPSIGASGNGQYTKIKGVYCAKQDIYVFAVFDNVHVKMVGATLAQLKASSNPSGHVAKYFTPSKKSDVDVTNQDQLCKIWARDGYNTKSNGSNSYKLKDAVVNKCAGTLYTTSLPCLHKQHAPVF